MESLHGVSLRVELRAQKRLTAVRTAAILRDLAAAVDAAHARNLVHRDLQPEIVFLAGDTRGQVQLPDLGLAMSLAGALALDPPRRPGRGSGFVAELERALG